MKYFKDKNMEEYKQIENDNQENNNGNKINNENENKNLFTYFVYFILISVFIGIAILIVTLIIDKNAFNMNGNISKWDDAVIKPVSDFRKYRTLYLRNGLEAVIISNPLTVTSGVSLSVRVGANNDPDTLLGLAHFCEHMLFLGSVKYPHGDDYFKIVTENNGHFNAYTDREMTNYFFDIHYFSFEKAIDIFSRFFIDPLFNIDKLNKEINSVNSEFEKNLIIDSRKRSQVFADLVDKESPFHRFTTGNIQTLVKNAEKLGLNLRDELIKFHKKYYVANMMKLIIYSNEDIDDVEEMIVEKFSEIKPSPDFALQTKTNQDNFMKNKANNSNKNQTMDDNFIKNHTTKNTFVNPFNKDVLGGLIKFNAITMEHELVINFIQKPLSDKNYFYSNPFYYFYYIFENKEDSSLIDILKKEQFATKLSVLTERDYFLWSDFVISINLSKKGINNLQKVLQIIHNYLNYMRMNLISEKYYRYLQKVSKMNFEYKTLHTGLLYELVSKLGARTQKYPLKYILDDIHLINPFNKTILMEYAEGLKLENSLMFLPNKLSKHLNYTFLIANTQQSNYEPWYRTNYTYAKINFDMIKANSTNSNLLNMKNNLKPIFEDYISTLINKTSICDNKCIEQMRLLSTSEPSLLNKTSKFELWYKRQNTLDFKKVIVNIQLQYEKKKNMEEKIHMLILETLLRRKLKKLNSKLRFISNSINVYHNNFGMKISYSSFNINIKDTTRELVDRLQSILNKEKVKDFPQIIQELHDHLQKDYNAQPWILSYEYLKKNVLNTFVTSEDCLKILSNVTAEGFGKFMNEFHKQYYVKFLIIGDIRESSARELFINFNPLFKVNSSNNLKKLSPSGKENKKIKRNVLKHSSGNFLMRKEYHQSTNKNNALLKCYKIGKKDFKNELMVKLFSSIIGNIVFRELRINKQFGYVAKSRVETFDTHYFYCLFVQGSSKLPHIIDEAAIELLETTIKSQLEKMSLSEFNLAKRKNFDTIADARFDLSKVSARYFAKIVENSYEFSNFDQMDKYSKNILKSDMLNFFNDKFLGNTNLKFTIYMYSQQIDKEKMKLKAQKGDEYEELNDI